MADDPSLLEKRDEDKCDQFTPKIWREHIEAHDRRMKDIRGVMGALDACDKTMFWDWVNTEYRESGKWKLMSSEVEVNKISGAVNSHLDALFPKRGRTTVKGTAATTGDHEVAELLLNHFMQDPDNEERFGIAWKIGLMQPGVGMKLRHSPGTKPAYQRVDVRVFPWWETFVDDKSKDRADDRFIGHLYYENKRVIADEYDIDLSELKGGSRPDYLEFSAADTPESSVKTDPESRANVTREPTSDRDQFIRVLEVCNLVDDYTDPKTGEKVKGRLEIHAVDQQGKLHDEALYVGALPLWDHDGSPLPHILTVIFEHVTGYPNRGVIPMGIFLPQQIELNVYRTKLATKASSDKSVQVAPEGAFGSDGPTVYADAKDGETMYVKTGKDSAFEKAGGDIRRLIANIAQPAPLVDIERAAVTAERDMNSNMVVSPAAFGVTQNVTAEEIRAQVDYTDSRFGRLAANRDRGLRRLAHRLLRCCVAAMWSTSDSLGAYEQEVDEASFVNRPDQEPGEHLDEEGAEAPEGEDIEERDDEDTEEVDEPEEASEQRDALALLRDAATPVEDDDGLVQSPIEVGDRLEPEVMIIRDPRGKDVEVTVESIDSPFQFGFSEEGRSPRTYAEMQANLSGPVGERYMMLWQVYQKDQDGPDGLMALEMMRALFEEFALPENLDPDVLLSKLESQKEEQAEAAPPAEELPEAPPPTAPQAPGPGGGGPAGPPTGAPPEVAQFLQQVAQMPPDDALQALQSELGNHPELGPMVQQAMQMPPEARAEAVQIIIQAVAEQLQSAA